MISDAHSHDGNNSDFIDRKANHLPFVSVGIAVPSITPQSVGDIYVDTNNVKVYIATGISSSSDWTVLN